MHSQLRDKAYLANIHNGSIMIEFKFKKMNASPVLMNLVDSVYFCASNYQYNIR